MATYRKRGSKWQAIVRHKTIGTTSRSFHTKQAAIKWVISVEEQLEAGTFGTLRPTHITLVELLQRYAREVTPAKRGATTELRRLQRLIRDPVSSLKGSQLTSQAIAAFRDRRLLDGRRTCHYDLILIRHCLKIAMNEWGLMLSANPVDRVKMPPSSPARNRRLESGEFERLEEASKQTKNPHIWPVIVFAIETGMRRGEILGLRWEHVDLDRRIVLPAAHQEWEFERSAVVDQGSSGAGCAATAQRHAITLSRQAQWLQVGVGQAQETCWLV